MKNLASHRQAYFNACNALEDNGQYMVNGGGHGRRTKTELANRKNIKVTQSFLQSECTLNVASTAYNFGILDTQLTNGATQLQPTEQRLRMQDVFFTYELAFYVLVRSTAGANTSFKYQYMTFPNPNFFGGGINLDQMYGLWTSGRLQVSVNNDVLTPSWDVSQHMYIPETQIQGPGSTTYNYFNQIRYAEDGVATVEPNWILNGGNNNQYIINYPQPLTAMNFGSYTMSLILQWRGFLAQNASSIMDAK